MRGRWPSVGGSVAGWVIAALLAAGAVSGGQLAWAVDPIAIDLPAANPAEAVRLSAPRACRWTSGGFVVWHLRDGCLIRQGDHAATADEAVIWVPAEVPEPPAPTTLIVYLERNVQVVHLPSLGGDDRSDGSGLKTSNWLGRFRTTAPLQLAIPVVTDAPPEDRSTYDRGLAERDRERAALTAVAGASFTDTPSSRIAPTPSERERDTSGGFWSGSSDGSDESLRATSPRPERPRGTDAFPDDAGGDQLWSRPSRLATADLATPARATPPPPAPAAGSFDPYAPRDRGPTARVAQAGLAGGSDSLGLRLGQLPPPTAPPGSVDPPVETLPFSQPPRGAGPPVTVAPGGVSGVRFRRVLVRPRAAGTSPTINSFPSPSADEQIAILTGGVRLIIEDAAAGELDLGRIDLETDRVVVWARGVSGADLLTEAVQADSVPLELYLEGNIVFRQGDRVVYANRMYFDVTARRGTILGAEVLTPVPEYQGLVRLKADVLQQLDEQTLVAYGAAATSSRLGIPRYWIQSDELTFRDERVAAVDPVTGAPVLNAITGEPAVEHRYTAQSRDNSVFVAGVPVFYWPTLRTDLTKPTYYVDQIAVRNDQVFGTQLLVDLDLYQILGIDKPPINSQWRGSIDGLSQRGVGIGTNFRYLDDTLCGLPGPYRGEIDAWGIYDFGRDNLGRGRRDLLPETRTRGRILATHRHLIAGEYQLTGEFGLISDRNFLEQYFEQEWDTRKDQTTGIELKRTFGNQTVRAAADVRINSFFTQTENLPRFDHFILGQSLFDDYVTWHGHSMVAYNRLRVGSAPDTNPEEIALYDPLPWEADVEGIRASTKHELSLPIDVGPARISPYVSGEVAYWGETLDGSSLLRGVGQAGVRGSLPMWRVDRDVKSRLFNLDGLAHKVIFDFEFLYADASQNLEDLPLYDQIDDDAQEFARRRYLFTTYGLGPGDDAPLRYDERFYLYRMGAQSFVASPSLEVADDLMLVRTGVRQRWQTQRGPVGAQHTVDYISLDLEATLFPRPEDHNFGAPLGLANYDFRWAVGDRVTILSDGLADFFGQGLRTASLGTLLTRPEQGSLYVGFRTINGPINSQLLSSAVSYRMSEKWIATAGLAYDFGDAGGIGQSLGFTRIGESFLVQVGLTSDISRGSVGFQLAVEPRFLPRSRLGNVGGVQIAPPGVAGFE